MKNTVYYLAIFVLLSVSTIAKTESQEAHIHGRAMLTLVLENEVLEIQFESPAANLIGFEHKARSPEEKQLAAQLESVLKSPKLLFSFSGTRCKAIKITVDISSIIEVDHDHHEPHHHEPHHHDSHSHSATHSDKGHSDNGHSEVKASYQFSCKDTNDLKSVSVALFNQFPRIEKINAMWVTGFQQGSELLNPNRNTFSLR